MCAVSPSTPLASADITSTAAPTLGRTALHTVLLAAGVIALLAGLCGALWRLGWELPHGSFLAEFHGPLMISGLFGTLIGLERALALGVRWAYAAPALAGFGTFFLLAGAPVEFGASAYAVAAAVLAGGALLATIRQPAMRTGVPLFGALAWCAGNVLWVIGGSVPELTGWWLTFLILTVAGERLELSRPLSQGRSSVAWLLFAVGLLLVGAHNGLPTENGAVLYGIALLLTASWLLRHDNARLDLLKDGQIRFMAACILAGHLWLFAAGLVLIAVPLNSGFGYDITLHAVLIGFVLSMAFGHAPVVLPSITRRRLRYGPILYAPLLLLHGSVALRVIAGLAAWDAGRQASGLLTLLALAGFVVSMILVSWNNDEALRPAELA